MTDLETQKLNCNAVSSSALYSSFIFFLKIERMMTMIIYIIYGVSYNVTLLCKWKFFRVLELPLSLSACLSRLLISEEIRTVTLFSSCQLSLSRENSKT